MMLVPPMNNSLGSFDRNHKQKYKLKSAISPHSFKHKNRNDLLYMMRIGHIKRKQQNMKTVTVFI